MNTHELVLNEATNVLERKRIEKWHGGQLVMYITETVLVLFPIGE